MSNNFLTLCISKASYFTPRNFGSTSAQSISKISTQSSRFARRARCFSISLMPGIFFPLKHAMILAMSHKDLEKIRYQSSMLASSLKNNIVMYNLQKRHFKRSQKITQIWLWMSLFPLKCYSNKMGYGLLLGLNRLFLRRGPRLFWTSIAVHLRTWFFYIRWVMRLQRIPISMVWK